MRKDGGGGEAVSAADRILTGAILVINLTTGQGIHRLGVCWETTNSLALAGGTVIELLAAAGDHDDDATADPLAEFELGCLELSRTCGAGNPYSSSFRPP